MYQTTIDGKHYELGTSGFLYRSNKLMYDHETKSMWSTLDGRPVVGPLIGKGLQLESQYLVTTTWGDWKQRHPNTTALSLDTGHKRDYNEGAAYAQYFGTDRLMFTVPGSDTRLKNKDEVLVPRFNLSRDQSLAISADFLTENPVYHDQLGDQMFVVLTDQRGANRIYETGTSKIDSWNGLTEATDVDGGKWTVTEHVLIGPKDETRKRLPAHRVFWFGWHAQYPKTRLVK